MVDWPIKNASKVQICSNHKEPFERTLCEHHWTGSSAPLGGRLLPGTPKHAGSSLIITTLSPLPSHPSHHNRSSVLPLQTKLVISSSCCFNPWTLSPFPSPCGPKLRLRLKAGPQVHLLPLAQPSRSLSAHSLDTLMTQVLRPLDQGVILSLCDNVSNSHSRMDGAAMWQKFYSRSTRISYKYLSHPVSHKAGLNEKNGLAQWWAKQAFTGHKIQGNGSCCRVYLAKFPT